MGHSTLKVGSAVLCSFPILCSTLLSFGCFGLTSRQNGQGFGFLDSEKLFSLVQLVALIAILDGVGCQFTLRVLKFQEFKFQEFMIPKAMSS